MDIQAQMGKGMVAVMQTRASKEPTVEQVPAQLPAASVLLLLLFLQCCLLLLLLSLQCSCLFRQPVDLIRSVHAGRPSALPEVG